MTGTPPADETARPPRPALRSVPVGGCRAQVARMWALALARFRDHAATTAPDGSQTREDPDARQARRQP